MKEVLLVFVGSGAGGALRYLVNVWFPTKSFGFPVATLLVNIVASFVIGLLLAMLQKQTLSQQQYLLLAVGFCGGLSTFSAFAVENQQMISFQQFGLLALYVSTSVIVCLAAVALGKCLIG